MSAGRKSETDGSIDSRSDDCGLARLPSGRDLAAEKTQRLALVIEGLSVAADQVRFHAELPLGSQYGIGIKFAKEEIQA